MRAVIQRVSEASVTINASITASIKKGIVVLLGVSPEDTADDIKWLSLKIANLRIFKDTNGLMNNSIKNVEGNVLLISQFTLFASTKKGTRPGFTKAAKPEIAIPIYEAFITQLTADLGKPIQTGRFGADMAVSLCNDGPVTITIDTKHKE